MLRFVSTPNYHADEFISEHKIRLELADGLVGVRGTKHAIRIGKHTADMHGPPAANRALHAPRSGWLFMPAFLTFLAAAISGSEQADLRGGASVSSVTLSSVILFIRRL